MILRLEWDVVIWQMRMISGSRRLYSDEITQVMRRRRLGEIMRDGNKALTAGAGNSRLITRWRCVALRLA